MDCTLAGSVFFDAEGHALTGVPTIFNPTSSFSFSCEEKEDVPLTVQKKKKTLLGAYRQSASLTTYFAFASDAASRLDLLLFPLPLVQIFTITAAGAAAEREEYQIDKHSALTQVL